MADQLVQTPLWEHQRQDVEHLYDEPRVIVGNDMGSGKTLTAIERDLRYRADGELSGPTLVVAPLATHDAWTEALERETGEAVRLIDRKNRHLFLAKPATYYVAHYDAVRLMPELRQQFDHIICDEAHAIKNRKAKTTKAVKKLRIPFITDMSGSPATNRPADFWSILNHVKPRTWSSYWKFVEDYVEVQTHDPRTGEPLGYRKLLGPKPAWMNQGLPSIRSYYVRRTKAELMPYLPEKVYGRLVVDLAPAQQRAYMQMKKEMIAWVKDHEGFDSPLVAGAVVAQLQRLQMFALANLEFNSEGKAIMTEPSAKLDAVMDILEENPDEQFVIFSQFKQPLVLLGRRLDAAGISYGTLTGDDSDAARAASKSGFIAGTRRCFLGTIGAGGEGVDGLQQAASTVIFLDRAWQPLKNIQTEDRLHRGGQTKTVTVIDVMARNTVDFLRAEQIKMKKDWILKTLGDM